mmetsp:Transcript_19886/g.36018  ORF Transcript_19886/g.36018 Transcript_19886/m.36018 type:complete len:325 (+) Transcript_19886:319-1293(+)
MATDCEIRVTSGAPSGSENSSGEAPAAARSFAAHRLVLSARSPYLNALFASPMLEAQSRVVNETEVDPDVFEQLLIWIYTDTLDEGVVEAMGCHLLLAADKYGCEGLKLLCELELCSSLTVENVAGRLVLGEQAEAEQLKEDAMDFIVPRAAEVMSSAGWQEVIAGGASLVSEVLAQLAGAQGVGTGGTREAPPSREFRLVEPVRKRSADEAGLVPNMISQRRHSISDSGTEGSSASTSAETGGGSEGADIRGVARMRVAKLRRELVKRGLSSLGRRGRLVERLQQAFCIEEKQAARQAAAERERLERERERLVNEADLAESDM